MSNPLFNQYGNQGYPYSYGNPMLQQFMQFKNSFSGDPKQAVQNLMASGQMSQQQFNQLAQQATQLQQLFHL